MSSESDLRGRGAEAVLRDHLRCWRTGTGEEDLERNYAGGVVLLTDRGRFCGPDGLRRLNEILLGSCRALDSSTAPSSPRGRGVSRMVGLVEGRKEGRGRRYLPRPDGRIVLQTVHYTVTDAGREDA